MKLGDKVRDTISGFTGICTGITDFLHGCRRICISPEELKDGKPIDAYWIDDPQAEVIESRAPYRRPNASLAPGGPRDAPTRNADPSR